MEDFDRGTRFVLSDGAVETKYRFSDIREILPESAFVQCHRAYVVNLAWTRRISQYSFLLKSGEEVHQRFAAYFVK